MNVDGGIWGGGGGRLSAEAVTSSNASVIIENVNVRHTTDLMA